MDDDKPLLKNIGGLGLNLRKMVVGRLDFYRDIGRSTWLKDPLKLKAPKIGGFVYPPEV